MNPLVVVIRGFVEKGLSARVAVVLCPTGVDQLVCLQGGRRVEALPAGLAAERRHVHCGPVPSIDNSAISSFPCPSPNNQPVSFIVSHFLVFLQLTVVQKRLSTQVTHERL